MLFEEINTGVLEGRLLMAALAIITTESQKDKTPFQVMEKITELSNQMYPASAQSEKVSLIHLSEMCTQSLSPELFEQWENIRTALQHNRKALQ